MHIEEVPGMTDAIRSDNGSVGGDVSIWEHDDVEEVCQTFIGIESEAESGMYSWDRTHR